MKKISIVILNYINYKDTIECIESIFEMNYRYEGIVVVDNNSENESVKILNKKYKDNKKIIIVKARHNYGFAKGNNIGICKTIKDCLNVILMESECLGLKFI